MKCGSPLPYDMQEYRRPRQTAKGSGMERVIQGEWANPERACHTSRSARPRESTSISRQLSDTVLRATRKAKEEQANQRPSICEALQVPSIRQNSRSALTQQPSLPWQGQSPNSILTAEHTLYPRCGTRIPPKLWGSLLSAFRRASKFLSRKEIKRLEGKKLWPKRSIRNRATPAGLF